VHPWTRGSSDLYTLEHFRSMRAHLAEGGVASQWLPLYELSTDDVKTIVATWCAAFERVSAWLTAYDLVLVGSGGELAHERDLCTLDLPPRVRAADEPIGVALGVDLAVLSCANDAELRALVEGVSPMRDDRPVIEFRAPLSALSGYSTEILRWAVRDAFVESVPPSCRARARAFRALVARFLDDLPHGFTPAADRLGEELARLPLEAPSEVR
jgi:spermidine synthase